MKTIKNDTTTEKIIQTAVRIIERDGYEMMSLRTIAAEMGTSIEVIKNYFCHKEDIVLEIFDRLTIMGILLREVVEKNAEGENKIRRFISLLFEKLEMNPEWTTVLFLNKVFQRDENLRNRFQMVVDYYHDLVRTVVYKSGSNGSWDSYSSNHFATIVHVLLREIIDEWRSSGFTYSLRDHEDKIIPMLERMYVKR